MIQIVEGSLDESKEKMKKTISIVRREVSECKRSVKPAKRTKAQKATIAKHEAFVHFFRVSQMQPVFIENICINYLLYNRFMKKLKGFQIHEKIEEKKLIVDYQKGGTTGRFILHDITEKLEGLNYFPRGEFK